MEFTAGGTGFETLTDDQRAAWRDVRTNELVRVSFAESSGAIGAFALPLQPDDTVMLISAGAASPFRRLARTVIGTSNTWNGVVSQGVTANWVAEAAAVSDVTPSIGQLVITPYKEAAWITGSVEVLDDTPLDQQLPAFIQDARTRLEATAFTTGTGSGQPFGVVTRAASDATTGALAASHIYALLAALGPRFRVYDGARPAFLANIAIINAARQIAAFTGANFSIVNDSGPAPRMLGLPFEEASAMTSPNTTGAKNLLIGDFSNYVVVDRLPTVTVFEPLVFNATGFRLASADGSSTPGSAPTSPRPVPRSAPTHSTCTRYEARDGEEEDASWSAVRRVRRCRMRHRADSGLVHGVHALRYANSLPPLCRPAAGGPLTDVVVPVF